MRPFYSANREKVGGGVIPRMMVERDVRMVAAQNRNEDNPPRREWSEGPRQTQGYDIAGALLVLETFKITLDHGS